MTTKENAFDLLRLLLATCVLASHAILIGGYNLQDPVELFSKGQTSLAELSVLGFFALSGFLISASYERSKSLLSYLGHRALRILPGFWICLLVTGFILAPLIFVLNGNRLSGFAFTGSEGAIAFIYKNLFLNIRLWSVRSVLDHAAYRSSLNGSLWSLYPEMLCYCLTMVTGFFGLLKKNRIILLIFAFLTFIFYAGHMNFFNNQGPTFLILSPAFKLYTSYISGMLIWTFRDRLIFDKKGTAFLALFSLSLLKFGGFNLAGPLLLAIVLINSFQFFEIRLKYDISYGIYIYSFPIQQLLYHLFGNRLNIALFIAVSLLTTAIIGFMSYVFIEKPFINLRRAFDKIVT